MKILLVITLLALFFSIADAQQTGPKIDYNAAHPQRFQVTVAIGGAVQADGNMVRIESELPRRVGDVFTNRTDPNHNLYCPPEQANVFLQVSIEDRIDWVMIVIHRELQLTHSQYMPGILTANGQVLDPTTGDFFVTTETINGYYFLQVRHPNSLKIKSRDRLFCDGINPKSVDFRNYGLEPYYQGQGGYLVAGTNVTAMYNGDLNSDGTIDGTDDQIYKNFQNQIVGYDVVDCSAWQGGFDGHCNESDLIVIENNLGRTTNVENIY